MRHLTSLKVCGHPTKSIHSCSNRDILSLEFYVSIRDSLLQRFRHANQTCTEELALIALALRASEKRTSTLVKGQLSCGAWSTSSVVGPPNAFHTAFAILALRSHPDPALDLPIHRGLEWLAALQPTESHWLWKWKFRFFDRQVRFDPDKFGWPWIPGTVSWVAPTALSMLAFREVQITPQRLRSATAMLLDRACPSGGWNAGNSVVFDVALDPHPDFTAMALLALRDLVAPTSDPIRKALAYLPIRLASSHSIYSLAWGTMALAVHQSPQTELLRCRLEEIAASPQSMRLPPRILALASLALEHPTFTFREFSG